MKNLPLYQIDAFTRELFKGNPAAVIPLDAFLPDAVMQAIAAENNLAETAFVVARLDGSYDLRWFTPLAEIEFCGHATIASAHTLIAEQNVAAPIVFHTQIGALTVEASKDGYTLHAPNYPACEIPICPHITAAFGNDISGAYTAKNNLYIAFKDAHSVVDYQPNMAAIISMLKHYQKSDLLGVSIMAAGSGTLSKYDFVSRHFAPLHGVDEDPVTGSAHSALAPFWANRLGKTHLLAKQCSARGGELSLHVLPNEVLITGQAITYLRGTISVNN